MVCGFGRGLWVNGVGFGLGARVGVVLGMCVVIPREVVYEGSGRVKGVIVFVKGLVLCVMAGRRDIRTSLSTTEFPKALE